MDVDLKPCPFCGGEARLVKIDQTDERFVMCGYCGICTILYGDERNAIYAWNKRIETTPFKKHELEFIIKVLLHDSVAKQSVDIMRVNIIRKCQKLIKDSPLELISVDKIALDRLLKRGENEE